MLSLDCVVIVFTFILDSWHLDRLLRVLPTRSLQGKILLQNIMCIYGAIHRIISNITILKACHIISVFRWFPFK